MLAFSSMFPTREFYHLQAIIVLLFPYIFFNFSCISILPRKFQNKSDYNQG